MSHPIDSLDPHPVAVTRRAPGGYIDGTWKPGQETALNIVATIQATDARTALLLPEGKRNKASWTIYTRAALQSLNEKTGQPADLLWIEGKPYEISLSWDHTRRDSELAYFKAVVTEINTVSGPSDYALAAQTISGPNVPLCFRPTGTAGRLYVVTNTEEDAAGYAGPSRSGGAPGETVHYTLSGNIHSGITGTAGVELYAYNGAFVEYSAIPSGAWTIRAGVLGPNGLSVDKGDAFRK